MNLSSLAAMRIVYSAIVVGVFVALYLFLLRVELHGFFDGRLRVTFLPSFRQ